MTISVTANARRILSGTALALCAVSASAGFYIEDRQDDTADLVYRSYVYGGLGADGTFSFPDNAFTGVDYLSNTAPMPLATARGNFEADGASVSIDAWAAYSGFYAARNYASMTVHNASPDHVYYAVAGHGTSTTLQFFTAEAQQARAVFNWRVDGVQTNGNPNGQGRADPRIDFYATTASGGSWFNLFDGTFEGSMSHFGQGSFSYTLPLADIGETIHLYYWASAFTELQAGQSTDGGSFTMTADFGHTYVLESVALLDENDNPLSEFTVLDADSGTVLFDQTGRIAEVLATPVPEPQTYALWLLGLAGLGAWRHRRRAPSVPR